MKEVTLSKAISTLREEKNRINAALGQLPAEQWLSKHGRELANREQELHITLVVLNRMMETNT